MKHVENTLAQVGELRANRQQQALAKFGDLVRDLADGKQPKNAEQVDGVLLEAAKTPADLATAVEVVIKKREWQKLADDLPKREAAVAKLRSALNAFTEERKRAIEELDRRGKELEGELRRALLHCGEAKRARDELAALEQKQQGGRMVQIVNGQVKDVTGEEETVYVIRRDTREMLALPADEAAALISSGRAYGA